MYLRNCWYVAGWSAEIGQSLKPVRLLGEDIVLYRTPAGEIGALEDACPHRKLPLSKGTLQGDRIVCGYHGLTFDRRGMCVAALTQTRVPTGASVKRFAALERYGFVWLWMGNAEQADPAQLIDIPNYDDPAWGRTKGGDMPIACHYLYITDNLLDPSHVAWVHLSSFAGAKAENEPLKIDVGKDGVTVWRWLMDTAPPAYYAPLLKFSGTCDRKQHYECVVPSIGINKSFFAPAGHGGQDAPLHDKTFVNISYNFMTPVDEDNSRYYWFQHRNSDPANETVSEQMNAGALMAFIEDRNVLEAIHLGMKNRKTPNIDLGLDAGALRFRKLLKARIDAEAAGA
ncbi:MAG: aromatic ring-hydroxylating dioxygenase subunit alpha [Alphaproteobacteria bacterium]|nr:aromatic ring-hydroxylating dioxygenase subunit alpha [Alphaproteobacteria bacterium]